MVKKSSKRSKLRKILVFLVSLALSLVAAEIVLRLVWPLRLPVIGYRDSANAKRYGYGFAPSEPIVARDPDTGEVYVTLANNHGWRDRDRRFDNPDGAFRIVILGDSNTFGQTVALDQTYPPLLEGRLQKAGYNVEVIPIALGAWDTTQELEALRLEGIRYQPDLVILQFSLNDIRDNVPALRGICTAPFYYTLDESGRLVRHRRPSSDKGDGAERMLKRIIMQSELLKRMYWWHVKSSLYEDVEAAEFQATEEQIEQIRLVLGLDQSAPFVGYLRKHRDEALDRTGLLAAIERCGLQKNREVVLRILEKRRFRQGIAPMEFHPSGCDGTSYAWQLFFALVEEMARVARENGAEFALYSEHDVGLYEWEVSWHRVSDDPRARERYLEPNALLRRFARQQGFDFIENPRPIVRARNDPHASPEGNAAMAENLFDYLAREHRRALETHRKRPSATYEHSSGNGERSSR